MAELKPPLTYEEQVNFLINEHKLTIGDRSVAINILKMISYYRLSGYGIGLMQKENQEWFANGITLEYIFRLYQFDSSFKNLLIHIIEQIEVQLRAQISNFLAIQYGAEGYTDSNHFVYKEASNGESLHNILLEAFRKEYERHRNVPFVKHHIEKYNSHFPIWVAIELFSFGNISSLYNIMMANDRKHIADLYNTSPQHLGGWIIALVEIRNICAHYGRLYNMPLKQMPYLYREHRQYRTRRQNKIFPAILVIKYMLKNDKRWKNFLHNMIQLIDIYYDVVRLSYIGFPNTWKTLISE